MKLLKLKLVTIVFLLLMHLNISCDINEAWKKYEDGRSFLLGFTATLIATHNFSDKNFQQNSKNISKILAGLNVVLPLEEGKTNRLGNTILGSLFAYGIRKFLDN